MPADAGTPVQNNEDSAGLLDTVGEGAAKASPTPGDVLGAACMVPGSAAIFRGGCFYAAGANTTDIPRAGMVTCYSLGWLRQDENQ